MASKKKNAKKNVMVTISRENVVMIAAPPRHEDDNYVDRAAHFCAIPNIDKIVIDWEGNFYVVNKGDLYVGPMPTSANMNWYDQAQKVGTKEFTKYMHLFFHPNGDLWGVTYNGNLYVGPKPTNKHLTWTYGEATLSGEGFAEFFAIFFDVTGTLNAVDYNGTFYRGPAPTLGIPWMQKATAIMNEDWYHVTHLVLPDADGNLWSVNRMSGNLYKGPMPNPDDNQKPYFELCQNLGQDCFQFNYLFITVDKTVESIFGCQFLPEKGKSTSESTEALDEKIYDNRRSSNVLKHTFRYSKKVKHTSSFSHEHGFTFGFGLETSFSAGVPGIGQGGTTVTMNASTTHNWSFSEENETEDTLETSADVEDTLETSADVEVEPGHAIRVVASVKKAVLEVPYRAHIRTMFGGENYIEGIWRGVANFNLVVIQEDYNG